MGNYTYENCRDAYAAIVKVGSANVRFGPLKARIQHTKNLLELDDKAKELYEKLLNDPEVNY